MTKQWLSDSYKLLEEQQGSCAKQVEETYKVYINDRTITNFNAYQAACDYQTSVNTVLANVAWWQPNGDGEIALAAPA